MPQVRLRVLGESLIEIGGASLHPGATHLFALALYLAIERGKYVSRVALTNLLFPHVDSVAGAHNLRQLVYRLKRLGAPVEATQTSIRMPSENVTGSPEAALTHTYSESLTTLTRSFVLLPGYEPPTASLSRWLEHYRDELSSKLTRRLARDLAKARQSADWISVDALSRAILEIDPLNESATLALAEALARTGSKHKAVSLLRIFAQEVGDDAAIALPSRVLSKRISEDLGQGSLNNCEVTLVGRATEMEQLTQAWGYSRRGHCSIVSLVGEKLIGKSRLLAELQALIKLDGSGAVLLLRSTRGDRARPLALFADLCARLSHLPGAAGCSPSHMAHVRRLTTAQDSGHQPRISYQDESTASAATRVALIDLLESVAVEQALLICIDDAEHLDDASRELLLELPMIRPQLPAMFVIATERPFDRREGIGRLIRLRALSTQSSQKLIEQLAHSRACEISRDATDWCVSTAAGNPGHLELLLAHAAGLREMPDVPPDFIALHDARIASLATAARHALQASVVFGVDCSASAVAALTGLEGYELINTLEQLVEQGLLTDGADGLTCRSSVLSSRVTASITPTIRCLLHRRSAAFLESTADDFPPQAVAWRIADHWQLAGERSRSLHWRRVCWQQLLDIGQPAVAAQTIKQCLTLSKSDRERAELLDDLANALQCASDGQGQLAALTERLALCDRIGDSASSRLGITADIIAARASVFDDVTPDTLQLQELLRSVDLDEARRLKIARLLVATADLLVDADLAREALKAIPEAPLSISSALLAHQVRAIYHAVFGDRSSAVQYSERLQALATSQELSGSSVSALLTAELACRMTGTAPMPLDVLRTLYEKCVAASMHDAALKISARIGSVLMEQGSIGEAARWSALGDSLVEQGELKRQVVDYLTLKIDLALVHDDFRLARALLDELPERCPIYASPKWRMEYLAYRVRVSELGGALQRCDDDLEAMLAWHLHVRNLGRHDDFMLALWMLLRRHDRASEASELLGAYVRKHRRERLPCSHTLRTHTAKDLVWATAQDADFGTLRARVPESMTPNSHLIRQ